MTREICVRVFGQDERRSAPLLASHNFELESGATVGIEYIVLKPKSSILRYLGLPEKNSERFFNLLWVAPCVMLLEEHSVGGRSGHCGLRAVLWKRDINELN